jgi:trigger factor
VETQPVTDAAVDQRIEQMRAQNAVVENAPADATVVEGDVLTVASEVYGEQGQLMENMSRPQWHLHAFREQLPAAVADQIVGKKAGETVEAKVENKATNRRGEEVTHEDTWKVTVKEIKRNRLPEIDDEFAKDLGDYATLDDLKAKVRKDLEEAEEQRQKNAAVGAIYGKLTEVNPLDVPASLESAQTYQLIMRDQDQLARYGMRLEHVIHDTNQYLRDQRATAAEMVHISLLLDEIAKAENLTVTDEDVDREIEKMAEQQGRKPLAVRARLEAQRQLDSFRNQVGRQKINDFLLANNTVTQVEAKPKAEEAPAEGEAKSE